MADQIGPQGGAGSPTRRSEPRPAAPPGDSRRGEPHAAVHDGVPEIVDTPADRQSRRYAHTLRRGGELSGPARVADAAAAAPPEDPFDAATITRHKPARPEASSPALEPTNRSSAPSDSTALYRKRTNPSLPTISPELIARGSAAGEAPVPEAVPEIALDGDLSGALGDDAPSRLPSVVLDASRGIEVYPLGLRRSPIHLALTIVAVALVAVAIWCFQSMF